ncbi:uncharacterized protein PgNI_06880, partial [Pyricularia grisea]|uniref:Uncharacterized protein n=1 Tax=Pyricularia grisea TaxID=148305 RepID=A0A6P8B0G9_PYRGI
MTCRLSDKRATTHISKKKKRRAERLAGGWLSFGGCQDAISRAARSTTINTNMGIRE